MLANIPIKIPYTTRPDMVRWSGNVGSPIQTHTLNSKRSSLGLLYGKDFYGEIEGEHTRRLIERACEECNKPTTTSIVDFALQFEEDVAILSDGVLQAICFCFPSGWIPRARVGQSLAHIHSHVADSERLVGASEKIAERMANSGPFRRYVWTVCNSGDLNQHPLNKSGVVPHSIDELYFRCETQTTLPLGDGRSSAFFVQVETYPLTVVFEDSTLKQTITASIDSMSDAVLHYKNLVHIKKLINNQS